MRALPIGRVFRIPLRMHWTFPLVLPVFAYLMARAYFAPGAGVPPSWSWFWGAALAVGLFASVTMHEIAHSLVARRRGIRVKEIVLLPIGGVSAFDDVPEAPRDELAITAAGPATNFAVGLPVLAAWAFVGVPEVVPGLGLFVFWLGTLNVVLGAFNLLVPAFPMDGGRILRAALTPRLGRLKATRTAALVGKGVAVGMGLLGLFGGGFLLVLIAVFVWFGAQEEERSLRITEALGRFRVEEVMTPRVDTLVADASVEEAFRRMLETKHVAFPVTDGADGGHVLGLVTLEALSGVPEAERETTRVRDVADAEFPVLSPRQDAADAAKRMRGRRAAVVLDEGGGLVGILTATDVLRVAEIASARAGRAA